MSWRLDELRGLANFQYGFGVGEILFPEKTEIKRSGKTGRTRYAFLGGKLLASVRTSDGRLVLTLEGAKEVAKSKKLASYVVVDEIGEKYCRQGRNLMAKYVVKAGDVLAGDEVVVLNEKGEVVAIGKAVLSSEEMLIFDKGIAVKVRKGVDEEASP